MQLVDHTKSIIELKNVSFSYNGETAIQDVNLEVHKGDYLGIIGPNGGGKSTTIKLMLGLLKPLKGEIFYFGKPISQFHDWSKIGYASQTVTHIDPNFPMTVEEVVGMGRIGRLGLFHFFKKEDWSKIHESLGMVDMWDYRKRLIGDLSGGQQQRVFIARLLAGDPEIIVLDEPTVGVDTKTQKQFYKLLQKLNREFNLTLILSSHELNVVVQETTEIAYVNGSLIYYGVPEKFMKTDYFKTLSGKEI